MIYEYDCFRSPDVRWRRYWLSLRYGDRAQNWFILGTPDRTPAAEQFSAVLSRAAALTLKR